MLATRSSGYRKVVRKTMRQEKWCGGYYIRAEIGCPRGRGGGDVEVHVYVMFADHGHSWFGD